MHGGGERLFQRADDEAAHEAGITEAHFGLGRVHVDVDVGGIAGDEQRKRRVPAGGQEIHVGRAHGPEQQLVAHGAPVDEQVERAGVAPVPGRQASEPVQRRALARGLDRQRVGGEIAAEHLAEALQQARRAGRAGGIVEARRFAARQREADLGMRHGEALQRVGHGAGFGAVALQELEPGGRRGKEVADLHARAERLRAGPQRVPRAAVNGDRVALARVGAAARHREQRDGTDGGQSLAAEAEGVDGGQVAVRQFRGGVALDAKREVDGVHAGAVVDDADEAAPARLDGDVDPRGARVERVLHQLLDGGGRALDDLARRDAVDEDRLEAPDRHGGDPWCASVGWAQAARPYKPTGLPATVTSRLPSPSSRLAARLASSIVTAAMRALRSSSLWTS